MIVDEIHSSPAYRMHKAPPCQVSAPVARTLEAEAEEADPASAAAWDLAAEQRWALYDRTSPFRAAVDELFRIKTSVGFS